MKWYITVAVQLVKAYRQIQSRKWVFFAFVACVFFGNVAMLGTYDLLPNPSSSESPQVALALSAVAAPVEPITPVAFLAPVTRVEQPVKIEISKIGLSVTVANPTSTNIEALDTSLLKGAVRYPTSAKLGEKGNVVLFGHSSYLPVVGNQAYKTFNGIQKLVAGDTVTVYSSGTAYTYRVRSMQKESANDAGINLAVTGKVLTLATCDSFGAKSDRFVVTADFVESHPVSASA
jgi:LPXTG-site transpeptidase (sortase) family protein